MERHYIIFVEYTVLAVGRAAVTQTLDVHSAGAELSALLQALDASDDVAVLKVCNKQISGKLNVMTKDDLGFPAAKKIK